MRRYLTMMNNNQKKAVSHVDGPMIVVAGPGSGKTHVLTNRISNLIDAEGVDSERILVITFSKLAAVEMEARFQKLRGHKSDNVAFATFHSLFFRVLRESCGVEFDSVAADWERVNVLKAAAEKNHIELDEEGVSTSLRLISNIKNAIDLKSLCNSKRFQDDLPCGKSEFNSLYKGYSDALREIGKLDFDDMVQRCYHLFLSNKEVLKKYQDRYSYVLIDEFQDINEVQFATIRMLVEPHKNIFVVGDDDQSIYGFLGSKPEIMLSFNERFKGAIRVDLDVNYRSHKEIVKHSQDLIKDNLERYDKDVKTHSTKKGKLAVFRYGDNKSQYKKIADDFVKFGNEKGRNLKDCCCIFRTTRAAGDFAMFLATKDIPFIMKEHVASIYKHTLIKDLLAYLELAHQGLSRDPFIAVMNKPVRYIKRNSVPKLNITFRELRQKHRAQIYTVDNINDFEYDLKRIKELPFDKAVDYIIKAIGYRKHITEYAIKYQKDKADLMDMIDTFKGRIADFDKFEEILEHIECYEESLKKAKRNDIDGVNIMTMHGSKGLEFPYVVVPNCNEDIIPHRKSIDIEEERRLLYVAMTRAEEKLELSYCEYIDSKPYEMSPFIQRFEGMIIDR